MVSRLFVGLKNIQTHISTWSYLLYPFLLSLGKTVQYDKLHQLNPVLTLGICTTISYMSIQPCMIKFYYLVCLSMYKWTYKYFFRLVIAYLDMNFLRFGSSLLALFKSKRTDQQQLQISYFLHPFESHQSCTDHASKCKEIMELIYQIILWNQQLNCGLTSYM